MKHYSPTGRRNYGRPLKRLLDTWDRNGSTSGPTPWQIYDDADDGCGDDDDIIAERSIKLDLTFKFIQSRFILLLIDKSTIEINHLKNFKFFLHNIDFFLACRRPGKVTQLKIINLLRWLEVKAKAICQEMLIPFSLTTTTHLQPDYSRENYFLTLVIKPYCIAKMTCFSLQKLNMHSL